MVYPTQDPSIRALARETASSHNMHLDVLAGVDAVNKGIMQNFSERKADVLLTRQKQQHNTVRIQAMIYFHNIIEERLTWEDVLFNDAKVDLYGENGKSVEYSCHCEKELV